MKWLLAGILCLFFSGCTASPEQAAPSIAPEPATATVPDPEHARNLQMAGLAIRIANNQATAKERERYTELMRGRR